MKTSKLLGFLAALILIISVTSCVPTYYTNRNGAHYGRRHYSPPPRPYHASRNYSYGKYGHPGW